MGPCDEIKLIINSVRCLQAGTTGGDWLRGHLDSGGQEAGPLTGVPELSAHFWHRGGAKAWQPLLAPDFCTNKESYNVLRKDALLSTQTES